MTDNTPAAVLQAENSALRQKIAQLEQTLAEQRQAVQEAGQTRQELQEVVGRLRKMLGTTIKALSVIVEARDPCTSGHQCRASDLARSIATEMRLPRESIEGIRIASSIHDIGMITIPAEILSKTATLSRFEMAMIKDHPQMGYAIMKDIDSPWPLARILKEHHERLDGTGYPEGLKGEELLIESRILMVADVVEAMCSHRPYRAALGIEAALAEIDRNSGVLYDPRAVAACRALFRERGYELIHP